MTKPDTFTTRNLRLAHEYRRYRRTEPEPALHDDIVDDASPMDEAQENAVILAALAVILAALDEAT